MLQSLSVFRVPRLSVISLKISNQTSTYFNSNGTVPLISLDELPMIASNLPGSATHSCLASSKKLNAFLSIVSVTAFSSPGASFTFLETFQLFYRTRRGFLITDIKLNNFLTFTSACILHIDCERNGIICSHSFLVGRGFSISESSVAQSMSEREQRFDFSLSAQR